MYIFGFTPISYLFKSLKSCFFKSLICLSGLQPGEYTLGMNFKGDISYDNTGFYKTVFENNQNTNNRNHSIPMAATRFKPTFARKAFPCFDEPSFKSTFNLTLLRRSKEYIALSNMDVEERFPDDPIKG